MSADADDGAVHRHDWQPYRQWSQGTVDEAWDECECGLWRRTQIGLPTIILGCEADVS
jgi:hypothetical protein